MRKRRSAINVASFVKLCKKPRKAQGTPRGYDYYTRHVFQGERYLGDAVARMDQMIKSVIERYWETVKSSKGVWFIVKKAGAPTLEVVVHKTAKDEARKLIKNLVNKKRAQNAEHAIALLEKDISKAEERMKKMKKEISLRYFLDAKKYAEAHHAILAGNQIPSQMLTHLKVALQEIRAKQEGQPT
jgi:hypothetical protein